MTADALKLTTYFGERDRAGGRFVADLLLDTYERQGIAVSVLLRGVEGFGIKHRLTSAQLLSLSEDLPLVAVAVDRREAIDAVLEETADLGGHGLISLETARLVSGRPVSASDLAGDWKLTVYVGRGGDAHRHVVDVLRRSGVAGATVLLGVDGTVGGVRERASFTGANGRVPCMVIAVGSGAAIAAALAQLDGGPLATLERVDVVKRDGIELAVAREPAADNGWRKLMVHARPPLHHGLLRSLREAGAAGATVLRGIWGYSGGHAPHGERFWTLRREVGTLTVIVDTAERMACWWPIVDEATREAGLVTSEIVPSARAGRGDQAVGRLQREL